MKKPLVTGCIIVVVVIAVIAIACAGVSFWGGSQFVANNQKVTKEMIGTEIPQGYMPMVAMDMAETGKDQKFSMLMGQNGHVVVLFSGPVITSSEDKAKFLENFQEGMSKSQSSAQSADFEEDGNITLNGKKYPKYKVSTVSNGKETTGMAVVLDYPEKSLLFVCMAQSGLYNPAEGEKFLQQIKLP